MFHGQPATTANLLAISCNIALNSEKKMLLMHNQLQHSALEYYLNIRNTDRSTKGIDPVTAHLKNMSLKPDEIQEYTTSILKDNRLDVLQGSKHSNQSLDQEFAKVFKASIDLADKYYDYVFIDAAAPENNNIVNLMETADLIFINVNQNRVVLSSTCEWYKKQKKYEEKIHILIGNYENECKFTLNNIKSKYGFKNVNKVNHDVVFKNHLGDSKTLEFLHKNKATNRNDQVFPFMESIKEVSDFIIDKEAKRGS
jgi:cellulose biosynthesis protein BcsQ